MRNTILDNNTVTVLSTGYTQIRNVMLHVNKVPGRPLRGHVCGKKEGGGGGFRPPPCSRLLATVALDGGATLHVVESALRGREVVERNVRDGERGEHQSEHGERREREIAGHGYLPSRATLACDVFIIARHAGRSQAETIHRYHTVIKRSVRTIERMFEGAFYVSYMITNS